MPSDAGSRRPRPLLIAGAVALVAGVIYCSALEVAPLSVTKDEASFAIQSYAVATTGRDINGNRLPLYFQEPGFSIGRDPIYIYATALVLQFVPLSESALRIPTTVAAAISAGLIVLVAYEIFGSAALAALAGLLLAVTPVFFIRSRAALSVMLPVPFQLTWLLFLLRYSRDGRLRQALAGVAALGVGVYSYLGMQFLAPMHLVFSIAEMVRRRQWRHCVIALAVFAVLMMPLAIWQLQHPSRMTDLATGYGVYPAGLTPLQGLKDVLSWSSLANRSDIYWNAFNPSRLFFSGESSLIDSTRSAGLYPVAYLILLPLGIYDFCRRPWSVATLAILSVFLIAPIPGALVGHDTIARYLIVAPLAALLAAGAIDRLWKSGWFVLRVASVAAVLLSVVLFYGFYKNYMTEWRVASAFYFGANLKGAMERVLAVQPDAAPEVVYLSEKIPDANIYWEFYRRVARRDDLIGRERRLQLTASDWRDTTGRALAIVPAGDDPSAATMTAAGWSVQAECGSSTADCRPT